MGFVNDVLDPLDFSGTKSGERKDALGQTADARYNELTKMMEGWAPTFQGIRDKKGNLLKDFSITGNLDKTALNELQKRALDPNQSAWAKMMAEKEAMSKSNLVDINARTGESSLNSAYSALASRGGLSQGARERIASKNAIDRLMGRQGIERDSAANLLNVGIEDERNKTDILKSIPGMQLGASQYQSGIDQFNMQNKIGDVRGKMEFDMAKYQEKMKAYAADRAGRAQEQSAGKK